MADILKEVNAISNSNLSEQQKISAMETLFKKTDKIKYEKRENYRQKNSMAGINAQGRKSISQYQIELEEQQYKLKVYKDTYKKEKEIKEFENSTKEEKLK